MSRKLTVRLSTERAGRPRGRAVGAGVAPGAAGPAATPPPGKIPRVARVLALAHRWQGLIRSGAVRDQAELARLVGVSRARVTQVMNLLWLAPDLQEAALEGHLAPWGTEKAIRLLATQPIWGVQRRDHIRQPREPHVRNRPGASRSSC